MSKEYLWVGSLSASKKEVIFSPSEEGDAAIGHSLLLKRAVLGPCTESELNVIEMETTGYMEDEIKATLCCLQSSDGKKYDQCLLDTLIPHGVTKFRLMQGSGPITLYGQHIAVDFLGEDELLSGDEEEELEDTKDEELLMEDKKGSKKRKYTKGGGLPKKMPKMDMEDMYDEDDDEDFDEEGDLDEDDDEFTPGKSKKKGPTPVKKEANAKKASKVTKKKN